VRPMLGSARKSVNAMALMFNIIAINDDKGPPWSCMTST
jgi:hypothetical protein